MLMGIQPQGANPVTPAAPDEAQAPLAPAPQPAVQTQNPVAALLQRAQMSPEESAILKASMQTPEDLYEEKVAKWRKKNKAGRAVTEVLGALLKPGYQAPQDRFRAEAQREYAETTPRLAQANVLDRALEGRSQAEAKLQQALVSLKQKREIEDQKNDTSNRRLDILGDRSNWQRDQGKQKIGVAQQLADLRTSLGEAQTRNLNQRTTNLAATGGMTGDLGNARVMSNLPQDRVRNMLDLYGQQQEKKKLSKYPPGSANQFTAPKFLEESFLNPETKQLDRTMTGFQVHKQSGEVRQLPNINIAGMNKEEADRVRDFGRSSGMARDLGDTLNDAAVKGNLRDFTGIVNGHPLIADLRARGILGNRSPEEAAAHIFAGNALMSHIASFAGKRITNKELDVIGATLGKPSMSAESILATTAAASLLLEGAQLRSGKIISDTTPIADLIAAEAKRYRDASLAGQKTNIRDLYTLLKESGRMPAKNAVERARGAAARTQPAAGEITLDEINAEVERRRKARGLK
jgi:hypothetical protein